MDTSQHIENIVVMLMALFLMTLTILMVFSIIETNTEQVSNTIHSSGEEAASAFYLMNREGDFGEQNLENLRQDIETEDGWNILPPVSRKEGSQISVPGKVPSPADSSEFPLPNNALSVPLYDSQTGSFYNATIIPFGEINLAGEVNL